MLPADGVDQLAPPRPHVKQVDLMPVLCWALIPLW
jgi:hypothetical protein